MADVSGEKSLSLCIVDKEWMRSGDWFFLLAFRKGIWPQMCRTAYPVRSS